MLPAPPVARPRPEPFFADGLLRRSLGSRGLRRRGGLLRRSLLGRGRLLRAGAFFAAVSSWRRLLRGCRLLRRAPSSSPVPPSSPAPSSPGAFLAARLLRGAPSSPASSSPARLLGRRVFFAGRLLRRRLLRRLGRRLLGRAPSSRGPPSSPAAFLAGAPSWPGSLLRRSLLGRCRLLRGRALAAAAGARSGAPPCARRRRPCRPATGSCCEPWGAFRSLGARLKCGWSASRPGVVRASEGIATGGLHSKQARLARPPPEPDIAPCASPLGAGDARERPAPARVDRPCDSGGPVSPRRRRGPSAAASAALSPASWRRRVGRAGGLEGLELLAEVGLQPRAVLALEGPQVVDLVGERVALAAPGRRTAEYDARRSRSPATGPGRGRRPRACRRSSSTRDSRRSALVRASPMILSASLLASSTSWSALRLASSSRRAAALDASPTVSTRIVSTPAASGTDGRRLLGRVGLRLGLRRRLPRAPGRAAPASGPAPSRRHRSAPRRASRGGRRSRE